MQNRAIKKPILVSIILPTYNEAENITKLIKQINKLVKYQKEIIVVDDNSPDKTYLMVKSLVEKNKIKNVRVKIRFKNRGLTNSIKEGIKIAKGEVIVWMDCDLSMPTILINELVAKLEEGYDIAVGSRFIKGGSYERSGKREIINLARMLSWTLNKISFVMLSRKFKDYTSGFIAVKSSVFEKVSLRGDYGEYFIDFIFKSLCLNYKIIEVPCVCVPRLKGQSKTGTNLLQYFRRGRKYISVIFRLLLERYILHTIP